MAPNTILVMRHAEKPSDAANVNLSEAGYVRAAKLVDYIPDTYGAPNHIFAAADSAESHRPVETVTPLAETLGKDIHADIKDKDYTQLADELLNHGKYDGDLVLVCWHHGKIPQLLNALEAPDGTYPDPWPEAVFNLVVRLDYDTTPPTVTTKDEPF